MGYTIKSSILIVLFCIQLSCTEDQLGWGWAKCDGTFNKKSVCVVTLEDLARITGDNSYLGNGGDAGVDDSETAQVQSSRWQSTPWNNSPWLRFPGQMTLKIMHSLGVEPMVVNVYMSFESDKSGCDKPNNIFLSSGDLSRIKDINAESVTFKNKTNENFCLRVVLE